MCSQGGWALWRCGFPETFKCEESELGRMVICQAGGEPDKLRPGKSDAEANVPFQKNPDLVVRNLQICHIHHWKWLKQPSLLLAWWV